MTALYDVVVVGGGIVGSSVAYHCVLEGLRTVLVDRADAGRATDAGAGILFAETSDVEDPSRSTFTRAAFEYYDVLLRHLQEDGGGETGYGRCGLLLVAASEDELEPFAATEAHVLQHQQKRAQKRTWSSRTDPRDGCRDDRADGPRELSPEQAQALFPPLARVHGALYFPNAARMDGRLCNTALQHAAGRRGLIVKHASVERLMIEGGRVTGVTTGAGSHAESYRASNIVIACGAWSQSFARQLGVHIPVGPQRGQIIHLHLSGVETGKWPIVNAFHGHYIVPWPGGKVVVGATRETGSGFDPRLTSTGVRSVLDEALRVATGLADAEIREMRVGLRPLSSDGRPVLGRVPGVEGVYLATGHGPAGLQLGPYSGRVICDLILGRKSEVDLTPFQASRFHHPGVAR